MEVWNSLYLLLNNIILSKKIHEAKHQNDTYVPHCTTEDGPATGFLNTSLIIKWIGPITGVPNQLKFTDVLKFIQYEPIVRIMMTQQLSGCMGVWSKFVYYVETFMAFWSRICMYDLYVAVGGSLLVVESEKYTL